jgi:hypothetical protein
MTFGPIVRLYTRELKANISHAGHPNTRVQLTPGARSELTFWVTGFDRFNGYRRIWQPTHIHTLIHSDASGGNAFTFGGWGAWSKLSGRLVVASGRWLPDELTPNWATK